VPSTETARIQELHLAIEHDSVTWSKIVTG